MDKTAIKECGRKPASSSSRQRNTGHPIYTSATQSLDVSFVRPFLKFGHIEDRKELVVHLALEPRLRFLLVAPTVKNEDGSVRVFRLDVEHEEGVFLVHAPA